MPKGEVDYSTHYTQQGKPTLIRSVDFQRPEHGYGNTAFDGSLRGDFVQFHYENGEGDSININYEIEEGRLDGDTLLGDMEHIGWLQGSLSRDQLIENYAKNPDSLKDSIDNLNIELTEGRNLDIMKDGRKIGETAGYFSHAHPDSVTIMDTQKYGGIDRILSHEMAHALDYRMGEEMNVPAHILGSVYGISGGRGHTEGLDPWSEAERYDSLNGRPLFHNGKFSDTKKDGYYETPKGSNSGYNYMKPGISRVTHYANDQDSNHEDFAESVQLYLAHPKQFTRDHPGRANILKEYLVNKSYAKTPYRSKKAKRY
jgi:hypothetical protein